MCDLTKQYSTEFTRLQISWLFLLNITAAILITGISMQLEPNRTFTGPLLPDYPFSEVKNQQNIQICYKPPSKLTIICLLTNNKKPKKKNLFLPSHSVDNKLIDFQNNFKWSPSTTTTAICLSINYVYWYIRQSNTNIIHATKI